MIVKVLKVHPKDDVIVALQNFSEGETIHFEGKDYLLKQDVPVKHKFAARDFESLSIRSV